MKIIIGNWKMNGNIQQKDKITRAISETQTDNTIILCPPFTLLNDENHGIKIGAQDISNHENGAYTGDISAKMVADTGAKYVIVGHSERRLYHNETNEIVHEKAEIAIKHNLIPIICVGETMNEKESGKTADVIKNMLEQSLPQSESGEFMVAYEPRWAIGTGKTPTMDEIESVHKMIFEYLEKNNREKTPILYGGSVNSTNASDIAKIPHVDGLLIGGASLETETFLPIIKSVK